MLLEVLLAALDFDLLVDFFVLVFALAVVVFVVFAFVFAAMDCILCVCSGTCRVAKGA